MFEPGTPATLHDPVSGRVRVTVERYIPDTDEYIVKTKSGQKFRTPVMWLTVRKTR